MIWFSMCVCWCFFFFNDTATTEIYTLSLHDALPISESAVGLAARFCDHALDDFSLQHEVHVDDLEAEPGQMEQQRRRNIVGQVADDPDVAAKLREVYLQRIGRQYLNGLISELLLQ